MNERILELANEANKDIGYTFELKDAKQLHELMEKFAELLIQECMKVTVNYPHPQTKLTAAEHIARHFGVE